VSGQFAANFAETLRKLPERHPLAFVGLSRAVPLPWLAKTRHHDSDISRGEEFNAVSIFVDIWYGMDTFLWRTQYDSTPLTHGLFSGNGGRDRDVNGEYQAARELPDETAGEKLNKERELHRQHTLFVDAATQGAVAVLNGLVPALNGQDEKKLQIFTYNDLFFCFATDSRDLYKDLGGDATAYKVASNDLLGHRILQDAVRSIAFHLTCILLLGLTLGRVELEGFDASAECGDWLSRLSNSRPGDGPQSPQRYAKKPLDWSPLHSHSFPTHSTAIQKDENAVVRYGSKNDKTINAADDFHSALQAHAKTLHLKEHKVKDIKDTVVSLVSGPELKGVLGQDGRKYLMEASRLTPRDVNYKEPHHLTCLLRHELISAYSTKLIRQQVDALVDAKMKEKDAGKSADELEVELKAKEAKRKADPAAALADDHEAYLAIINEIEPSLQQPELTFNVDLFVPNVQLADDPETLKGTNFSHLSSGAARGT